MQAAKLFLQQLTHVALKMEFRLARAHIQLWRAQEVECRLLAAKINLNYIFISRTQPPCALRVARPKVAKGATPPACAINYPLYKIRP